MIQGFNFSGIAAQTILGAAVNSLVVLTVAGLVGLLLRKASAATRHFVWLAALTSLLWLPLFSWLPLWHTASWPMPQVQGTEWLTRELFPADTTTVGTPAVGPQRIRQPYPNQV